MPALASSRPCRDADRSPLNGPESAASWGLGPVLSLLPAVLFVAALSVASSSTRASMGSEASTAGTLAALFLFCVATVVARCAQRPIDLGTYGMATAALATHLASATHRAWDWMPTWLATGTSASFALLLIGVSLSVWCGMLPWPWPLRQRC